MPDVTETPEYEAGVEWADENLPRLSERYTGRELATPELRTFLFMQAQRLYPPQRESMENELRQTQWVAGAMRRLVDTMPMSQEGAAAVFDASLELASILGAEAGKLEALWILKDRPGSWWKENAGDASPNDVVDALSVNWRRRTAPEKGFKHPKSKWEVLIDTLGSREMWALAELENITFNKDGDYWYYDVDGKESSFQVMARDTVVNGRVVQGTGEITG